MRRFLVGLFFVLHAVAHAFFGIRMQDVPRHPIGGTSNASTLVASFLFALAFACFVQAGLGAWGIAGLRRIWRPLARVAVAGSLLLLVLFITPSLRFALGIFLDVAALALADPAILAASTAPAAGVRG